MQKRINLFSKPLPLLSLSGWKWGGPMIEVKESKIPPSLLGLGSSGPNSYGYSHAIASSWNIPEGALSNSPHR
jgi:hypothetical protein